MSRTKLEAMVGLLAGHEVDPALLDELDDPSSESSRFLEATRLRSRALLGDPDLGPSPSRPVPGPTGSAWKLALTTVAVLISLSSTFWWLDRRLKIIETRLSVRDRADRLEEGRVAASLARLAEASIPPERFKTLEASIGRIEVELGRTDRKSGPEDIAPIVEQVAALRREISSREKAETRRAEEFQASVHETSRLLRLLLNRSDPSSNSADPPAGEPRRKSP